MLRDSLLGFPLNLRSLRRVLVGCTPHSRRKRASGSSLSATLPYGSIRPCRTSPSVGQNRLVLPSLSVPVREPSSRFCPLREAEHSDVWRTRTGGISYVRSSCGRVASPVPFVTLRHRTVPFHVMIKRQARRRRGVGYGASPFRPTGAHSTSTDLVQDDTRWGSPPLPGRIPRTVPINTDAAPPYRLQVHRSSPRPSSQNPLVRLRRLPPCLLRPGRRPAGSIQRRSTIIISVALPPRLPSVFQRFRTRSNSTWVGPTGTLTPSAFKRFAKKESASRTCIDEAETRRGRPVGATCP